MARPKSMPDFQALVDASTPLNGLTRKKPSISLAAGLIMAADSPRYSPQTLHQTPGKNTDYSDNLFYAYAQKVLSDYAQSPPYILTFASAAVCDQWWALVQREYPESTRIGPQLFILKSDDMQEQIQDNPRFYHLENKWFYAPSDGSSTVIPLQDYKGNPVSAPAPKPPKEETTPPFDMSALTATLETMTALITENTTQIRALSVAQSTGLQTMQEINESTSGQIKALADNQAKLQAMLDQNASNYIALSNANFATQAEIKEVLRDNAEQVGALAKGQKQLEKTCEGMLRGVEKVSESVAAMGIGSDIASNPSSVGSLSPLGAMASRISPPPRKLNRRIKGVWYEYDNNPTPVGSPRKSVTFLDTPPKTPLRSQVA